MDATTVIYIEETQQQLQKAATTSGSPLFRVMYTSLANKCVGNGVFAIAKNIDEMLGPKKNDEMMVVECARNISKNIRKRERITPL